MTLGKLIAALEQLRQSAGADTVVCVEDGSGLCAVVSGVSVGSYDGLRVVEGGEERAVERAVVLDVT